MKGKITKPQIGYVLYRLARHIDPSIFSYFRYSDEGGSPCIIMPLSEQEQNKVIWINSIPVLYPCTSMEDSFYRISGNNLIFNHDLFKSVFHLLSGYQEFKSNAQDEHGRFPYKESLQYKLGIVTRPIVNYYFEIIIEGIEKFCQLNGISFHRRRPFKNPVFFLSHDIDRVDCHHFYETLYKFKQFFGLEESSLSRSATLKSAFSSMYHMLSPFSKNNPFWNFDFLRKTESDLGMKSSYYFLEKDKLHVNSRYRFSDRRIRELIHHLSSEGHEIGLHGTIQSATDQASMNRTLSHLQEVSPTPVTGIRQHYLKFQPSKTSLIQEKAGLTYDSSLGFAEHEGFRNSYCLPFRLYDFREDRMMDLWEIPLNIMDGTLFYYRKLSFEQMKLSLEQILSEVIKFNGLFSLLWHNSHFDELEFPGVTEFYIEVIQYINSQIPDSMTGNEIMQNELLPDR